MPHTSWDRQGLNNMHVTCMHATCMYTYHMHEDVPDPSVSVVPRFHSGLELDQKTVSKTKQWLQWEIEDTVTE